MNFKNVFFQSTLILFVICFSSCEKEKIFIDSKESVNSNTNTFAKFNDKKTNKSILYVNKELGHEDALKLTWQFLLSYNLSTQTDDIEHFIYNEAQSKFVPGTINPKILIELNANQLELVGNHLITEDNSDDIEIGVFRLTHIIGGMSTIISVEQRY